MAATVVVATAGVGASVLVSGVGAAEGDGGCVVSTGTTERVTVNCYGGGGDLTVPGGTAVTVELSGASGGGVGETPGGRGGHVAAVWTPEADTALHVTLGAQGLSGTKGEGTPQGAGGGGASWIYDGVRPTDTQPTRLASGDWLWVAGGGGGAGSGPTDGAGGHGGSPDGGPDEPGRGNATGATQSGPGEGAVSGGSTGEGQWGGAGVGGGGSGGDGFYGGGGGGNDGDGGGGGSSNAAFGEPTYSVAGEPGDGTATFSWSTAPEGTAPQITSAATASFVAGRPGTFAITATGDPAPELSVGALPAGLTFTDDGDGSGLISGVPPVGYGGDSVVDVTAANGRAPDAAQQLQIHISVPDGPQQDPPPPFTPDFTPLPTNTDTQRDPELVPVADKTVVVEPVSGVVLIRRPDGTVTELKAGEEIPVGSVIDARDGVVRLIAARDANGVVQTALFWNAIFQVTQQADSGAGGGAGRAALSAPAASKKLLTELTLRQKPTDCAPSRRRGASVRAAKKGQGGLWGDGKGRFSVRGDSSSATVRGTKWYVENRCDGTYTRVVRGVVAVRDFTRKKTIVLRAGGTYTAKKPGS